MPVRITIRDDLAALSDTLGAIARVTGKDASRLVADATVQFLIGGNGITGMAKLTRGYAPAKGRISEVAKMRGYRVVIFHNRARERAERRFADAGGAQGNSLLVRFKNSSLAPSAAGLGASRRKNTAGLTFLSYRNGKLVRLKDPYKNGKGSNAERQTPVTTAEARFMGLKPAKGGRVASLNLRALTVYYELRARESSRLNLASSYAFKGLAALRDPSALVADARATAASGRLTGAVSYRTDGRTSATSVISNFIPMKRRDLDAASSLTLRAVLRDKQAYLARKIQDNFTRPARAR